MSRIVLSACLALCASTAIAADAVVGADPQPAAAAVDDSRFSLTLGGGVGFQPLYEGSDEYRAYAFPIIVPSFGASDGPRRFEFRGLDDVRLHALRFDQLSIGPLVGYDFGRDENDSDRLNGLGDIDGGLVVGAFVNYDFYDDGDNRFGASAAFSTQVTGDAFEEDRFAAIPNFRTLESNDEYGYEVDVSAHYNAVLTDRFSIAVKGGGVYADDNYMGTHFSVTPLQSTNAGLQGNNLAVYDAGSGLKNVYGEVSGIFKVTENFDLRAGIGYSRLVGDTADSPLTENENQLSGRIGAAYKLQF